MHILENEISTYQLKTAFSKFPEVKRSQPDGKTEVYDVEKAAGQLVNVYEFVDLGRLIKADLQR